MYRLYFLVTRSIVKEIVNALQEDALQALHEALEWRKAQAPDHESQIGKSTLFVYQVCDI